MGLQLPPHISEADHHGSVVQWLRVKPLETEGWDLIHIIDCVIIIIITSNNEMKSECLHIYAYSIIIVDTASLRLFIFSL